MLRNKMMKAAHDLTTVTQLTKTAVSFNLYELKSLIAAVY